MKKISTIVLILAIIVVLAAVGFYAYVYFHSNKDINAPAKQIPVVKKNTVELKKLPTPEEQLEKIKNDYPEVVSGVINFLDKGDIFKTTIKIDTGKIYTLSPAQPASVYESLGAKNGHKVELRAKSLTGSSLEWSLMRLIN